MTRVSRIDALRILVCVILIPSALSCEKDSQRLIDSYNIIDVDENSLNHYHLKIVLASSSILQRSDPVNFTADSITTRLRISSFMSGSGNVDVLDMDNNPLFAAAISRDTIITNTIRPGRPKRVVISFNRFSGGFEFQMD